MTGLDIKVKVYEGHQVYASLDKWQGAVVRLFSVVCEDLMGVGGRRVITPDLQKV